MTGMGIWSHIRSEAIQRLKVRFVLGLFMTVKLILV